MRAGSIFTRIAARRGRAPAPRGRCRWWPRRWPRPSRRRSRRRCRRRWTCRGGRAFGEQGLATGQRERGQRRQRRGSGAGRGAARGRAAARGGQVRQGRDIAAAPPPRTATAWACACLPEDRRWPRGAAGSGSVVGAGREEGRRGRRRRRAGQRDRRFERPLGKRFGHLRRRRPPRFRRPGGIRGGRRARQPGDRHDGFRCDGCVQRARGSSVRPRSGRPGPGAGRLVPASCPPRGRPRSEPEACRRVSTRSGHGWGDRR